MKDQIKINAVGFFYCAALLAFAALSFAAAAGDEPAYVGGKTVSLGKEIRVAVPEGWHRGTVSMEKEAEAYVLMYTGKSFDPETDEPHGIVRINPEVDVFESGGQLQTYFANVEKNLTKSGWTRGEIEIRGESLACYATEDEDSTTFCLLIPFGSRSVTTYTIIPKKGSGFPRYAIKLLDAISLM